MSLKTWKEKVEALSENARKANEEAEVLRQKLNRTGKPETVTDAALLKQLEEYKVRSPKYRTCNTPSNELLVCHTSFC